MLKPTIPELAKALLIVYQHGNISAITMQSHCSLIQFIEQGPEVLGFVGGAPPDGDLEMGTIELRLHLNGLPEADDDIVDVLAVEIPERVLDAGGVGVDDGGRVGVLLIASGSIDLRG